MTALLDQILGSGGLSIVFQPVVELAGGADHLHGLECLTRGPHGTNAAKAAVMFEYVRRKHMEPAVDRACVDAALHQAAALPGVSGLALNVHASTLGRDKSFPMFVFDAAARRGVHPARLTFEIVEHTHYWDGVTFANCLHELRAWGAKIALDDVGLGHSNYRMMLEVRPDYLKVDRYIVHGAAHDPHRRAVLESIAQLSRKLESRVVGEGVEDADDLAALRAAGIELAQGYFLATPLNADDLLASGWLRARPRRGARRRPRCTAA